MLGVTDFARKRRTVDVQYELEPGVFEGVEVTYTTTGLTPLMMAEIQAVIRGGDEDITRNNTAVMAQLCSLVLSWTLAGEDGDPYPLTTESLSRLPVDFLGAVYKALWEDMQRPNVMSAGSSGAGSSRTGRATSTRARNGTH